MNSFDLNKELSLNKSDKQLSRVELDINHKKWAEYILENKQEICNTHHPIIVKKKVGVRWKEFIDKIKKIFGLKPKEENTDGIEAYFQYCDSFE